MRKYLICAIYSESENLITPCFPFDILVSEYGNVRENNCLGKYSRRGKNLIIRLQYSIFGGAPGTQERVPANLMNFGWNIRISGPKIAAKSRCPNRRLVTSDERTLQITCLFKLGR